jgi:hypothetical protein
MGIDWSAFHVAACYGASISTGTNISTQGALDNPPVHGACQINALSEGLATTIYQNSFRFCLELI